MKLCIDTEEKTLVCDGEGATRTVPLYSEAAFEIVSEQWLKIGWNVKHVYTFAWLGRPIIQLPEDIMRIQEVIYRVKPDVVVETGIAHGGSLVLSASVCKAMGRGRVIGIDVEIRPHNRKAIEAHELFGLITLIEGDSIAPEIVAQAKALVKPGERALVILDSCHQKEHVLQELEHYSPLVAPGSYIVATDGSMRMLHDVPRGEPQWQWDNPAAAAAEFAAAHPEFVLEQPPWPFNESRLSKNITHWPDAFLRRVG